MELNISLLFYTANLLFIVTNLYGWLLKWFYKAEAYGENYGVLFPGQRFVGALYLVQLFELPYLLMVGNAEALFYVNAFSVLLFPALMVAMCEAYFFLKMPTVRQLMLYFLPVIFISGYLLATTCGWLSLFAVDKQVMFWIVSSVAAGYTALNIREQLKIRKQIRRVNENTYSCESDFPVRFAQRIEWLPLGICLLMYANFVADDVWVKMCRDILFTVVNVWFLLYTLNPHRRLVLKQEGIEMSDNGKYRLDEMRCNELQTQIFETIINEKLYLESHLSVDMIAKKVSTNKNYISEAFTRSKYGSFYNAINNYRIDHAEKLLLSDPLMSIEAVARASGFSSASLFSRSFKQYRGCTPTQFATKNRESKTRY